MYQPNGGTWYTSGQGNAKWEVAHEAGHLLGLPDRYHDVAGHGSQAETGFERNIMGAYAAGTIREQDIADIIAANPSLTTIASTRAEKLIESATPSRDTVKSWLDALSKNLRGK